MLDATFAVNEPQHADLETINDAEGEYVECRHCGRQWSVNGSHAEVVTEGDGFCDENTVEG